MNKGFTIICNNCGSESVTLIGQEDEYTYTVTITCDKCKNTEEHHS